MILSFWEGENEKVKSADKRDFGTRAYIHRWIAIGYPYVRWGENIMNNTKQSTTTAAVSQTRWVDMQFLRCIVMNCLSTNKQTKSLSYIQTFYTTVAFRIDSSGYVCCQGK